MDALVGGEREMQTTGHGVTRFANGALARILRNQAFLRRIAFS